MKRKNYEINVVDNIGLVFDDVMKAIFQIHSSVRNIDILTVWSAIGGKLEPYIILVGEAVSGNIDTLDDTVRAREFDRFVESRTVRSLIEVGNDKIAIITVPPFVFGTEWERNARQEAASVAWIGTPITFAK